MLKTNVNFSKLSGNYLFYEVAKRVKEFETATGEKTISLGVGDVTLPLPKIVANAFAAAAYGMATENGFRGYAPVGGYPFLKEAIVNDYNEKGVALSEDEVFISDGAKSDLGAVAELFCPASVLIPTPAYPAYIDANLLLGNEITYLELKEENSFTPSVEGLFDSYLIVLCSPNNPTGAAYSLRALKAFVDYAIESGSVIIYDNCYSSFVKGNSPKTIYAVQGAKSCAIEINSFSKSAGFTGVRCGYTVIPKDLAGGRINESFLRRQSTRFNGVSYPVQVAATAALTKEGKAQTKKAVSYYMKNAQTVKNTLKELGLTFFGGDDSPYIWLKCPAPFDGRSFFEAVLSSCRVVLTPGGGFGAGGENFVRISCFCSHEAATTACRRLKNFLNPTL